MSRSPERRLHVISPDCDNKENTRNNDTDKNNFRLHDTHSR